MKPLLYHIIACCAAVLFFTACDKECDIPGGNVVGDGNSIILDLSSGSLPMSRAVNTAATGAEVKVNHIDVLIFDAQGNKKHHERVGGSETGNGTIVLSAKRSGFTENAKYEVHLIANSTADVSVFADDDFDMTALKQLEQTDRDIHMTGYPGLDNVPQTFLMDGIAHLEGSTDTQVVLNDGNKSNDTKLKATLRRAAAKLVIKIHKGQFVEFNNATGTLAGYYLRNMPYSTSVLTGVNAKAELRTPLMSDGGYFDWTQDPDDPDNPNPDRPYTLITVTAYAYAHSWDNESSLEKETRLIVNIPMYTILHDKDGNYVDENGDIVTTPVKESHPNSYYQIPVCEGSSLERNTCYEVSLTLNLLGGNDPLEPVKLEDIDYEVREWDERTINIGGETDRPEYLTLNENEFEMHNMEDDHTTLQFSSSSEVTAEITKVYYIDKFGQEQELTAIPNTNNEYGVNTGTNNRPNWTNLCTLRITPDEGINGKIDVFGDVPENNAVRYIEFTVTNETGQTRSVTVAQYPLEYITNIQGWYSYRSDFGGTTWENYRNPSQKRVTAYGYNANNDTWQYTATGYGQSMGSGRNKVDLFFTSKVATEVTSGTNKGKSTIAYYYYNYNNSTDLSTEDIWTNTGNARMYHIQIMASSGTYTLGKPRITDKGITDPGKDNSKLVSPSFMLASQLGAVYTVNSVEMAASHCKEYVEVAKDGTVYDDWRLPTEAEIKVIIDFQYKENAAMDEVLAGRSYYSASGPVSNPDGTSTTGRTAIRCIRDAYNDKK